MSFHSKPDILTSASLLRHMAMDLEQGRTLRGSLQTLLAAGKDKSLGQLLQDLLDSLDQGKSSGQALTNLQGFDAALAAVVDKSEVGSKQAGPIRESATLLEESYRVLSPLNARKGYYLLLLIFAALVFILAGQYILPQFQSLYADANTSLPTLTATLLEVSQWMYGFGALLPLLLIFLLPLLPWGNTGSSPLSLCLFRRLELLSRHGIKGEHALHLALEAVLSQPTPPSGRREKRRLKKLVKALNSGSPLPRSSRLPAVCLRLLRASNREHQSDWATVADHLSELLNRQAGQGAAAPKDLLLVILIGVLIGLLVIGLYLPMFQLGGLT